uniref:Molybdopterin oxidoreductase domain-containing protein n=1 Tax=Denticeps clupeoides TaxID=299321 RepID=A0AAY4C5E7_9TELE
EGKVLIERMPRVCKAVIRTIWTFQVARQLPPDLLEVFVDRTAVMVEPGTTVLALGFLLANRPLDCPVCEQGDERDLPSLLDSYRPVSNLPFLSKILERAVLAQLSSFLHKHDLLDPFQSGFRKGHSTETSLLVKVTCGRKRAVTCNTTAFVSHVFFTHRDTESIGSSIVLSTRGGEIMRILRHFFAYGGLKRQILSQPVVKNASGQLVGSSGKEIAAVWGGMVDAKAPVALKDLLNHLNSDNLCMEEGAAVKAFSLILSRIANQVAALHLGYEPGVSSIRSNPPKVLFLLGANSGCITRKDLPEDSFIIYQGQASYTGAAYTEKCGTYVNIEGEVRVGNRDFQELCSRFPNKQLSGVMLPHDDLMGRVRLAEISPNLVRYDGMGEVSKLFQANPDSAHRPPPLVPPLLTVKDFYMTGWVFFVKPWRSLIQSDLLPLQHQMPLLGG